MTLEQSFDDRDLTWYFQVYRDVDNAELCLAALRRVYRDSRVIMISDGDDDARYAEMARRHDAEYVRGEWLFALESGAKMWQRSLDICLQKPCSHVFKIDSDTRVHRRFRFLPSGHCAFGTLEHRTQMMGAHLDFPNIQGGFMGFTRGAAETLARSGLLASAEMCDWRRIFADVPDMLWSAENRKMVCDDFLMRYALRALDIEVRAFSEVRSHYLRPLWRADSGDFAVTHPHKLVPQSHWRKQHRLAFAARRRFAFNHLKRRVKSKITGRA